MTEQEAAAVRDMAVALRDAIVADDSKNSTTRGETVRLMQFAAEANRIVEAIELLSQ